MQKKRVRATIDYDDEEGSYFGEIDSGTLEPDGHGRMTSPLGSYVEGVWVEGVLDPSSVVERDLENNVFRGRLDSQGLRDGPGNLMLYDGSHVTIGTWSRGDLHGPNITFEFGDGRQMSDSQWERGKLVSGTFEGVQISDEGPFPGLNPLVPDAYDEKYVMVRESDIPGSGQGLFARCDLEAGTIVSFYNGARVSQQVVDERSHAENSNVVLIDDSDDCIDVPEPFDLLLNYCATLGHKANHSENLNNCVYTNAFHPRFGHIVALRSTRLIARGEEILLDYEYIDKPPWM